MSAYSNYSDHELNALLKNNDHDAYTEIYSRYWKKMLLIAWNYSNCEDEAKDIVADVFISLWERRNKVDIDNLPAFLATAIKFNIFKNYQKTQRRKALAEANYEFDEVTNDESKLDALFLKEYINGIVEEMPEKCRMALRYSREAGLKNKEIADKINLSEKGVEANITKALKIIRGELKNYGTSILIFIALFLTKGN
jgi:RNA polymerase sigma-70 factor (family 1)